MRSVCVCVCVCVCAQVCFGLDLHSEPLNTSGVASGKAWARVSIVCVCVCVCRSHAYMGAHPACVGQGCHFFSRPNCSTLRRFRYVPCLFACALQSPYIKISENSTSVKFSRGQWTFQYTL